MPTETKQDIELVEVVDKDDIHLSEANVHGDLALQVVGDERFELTEEDNKRIRRKTDFRILTILVWVYFLQITDKSVFGYGNVFGMTKDAHLTGHQLSLTQSSNAFAQLAWQPFSAYLIVRVPSRILMPCFVFGWGLGQTCCAASKNFGGLFATRFLLGLFEAGCIPLFSLLTSQWYRRSEQPLRVAAWYGTNGVATIFVALVAYGFHIKSSALAPWQILFMFVGLVTVISVPLIYARLDSTVASARFFESEYEKGQAIERLRANQTGSGTNEFKKAHLFEVLRDLKTLGWMAITMFPNIAATVQTMVGPTLLKSFGFDQYTLSLLNIPFGALQIMVILLGSFLAEKYKYRSLPMLLFMIPVLTGGALLYYEATHNFRRAPCLVAYYSIAFVFGINPLLVAWALSNTAGQTKKGVTMSLITCAASSANFIGKYWRPLLFEAKDKPRYVPGVRLVLVFFVAFIVCVLGMDAWLWYLNKQKGQQRLKNGKPEKIHDTSMDNKYTTYGKDEGGGLGQNALKDLTDFENDEFVYVY